MNNNSEIDFSFIIDTNKLSSCESMCVFLTGQTEEPIFFKEQRDFEKSFPKKFEEFNEVVLHLGNEECEICRSEGSPENPKFLSSIRIFFSKEPSEKLIEFMKARAYEYGKIKEIEIKGFRFETN